MDVLVSCKVTLHSGEVLEYQNVETFYDEHDMERFYEIIHARKRQLAMTIFTNNHFFGSTIGPIRVMSKIRSGETMSNQSFGVTYERIYTFGGEHGQDANNQSVDDVARTHQGTYRAEGTRHRSLQS
jgi:hypothetical protein